MMETSNETTKKNETSEIDPRAPIEGEWAGLTVWRSPIPGDGYDSFDRDDVVRRIDEKYPATSMTVAEAIARREQQAAAIERADAGAPPETGAPAVTGPEPQRSEQPADQSPPDVNSSPAPAPEGES